MLFTSIYLTIYIYLLANIGFDTTEASILHLQQFNFHRAVVSQGEKWDGKDPDDDDEKKDKCAASSAAGCVRTPEKSPTSGKLEQRFAKF